MESGQVYEAGNGKEYDMLETERLLLRKWTEEDADSLFEYAKDPEVGPIAGWPPHRSREESLDVIRNVLNGRECYAICEKGNPKAIGAIELILNRHNDTENHDEECELGYWLGKREKVSVPLMKEVRTEHRNIMTKERWMAEREKNCGKV